MKPQLIASANFPVAKIQLSYLSKIPASNRATIHNAEDTYQLLHQNWNHTKINFIEEFKILLLNNANHVLALYEVSSGGTCSTIVDPKLILTAALLSNARKIILAHNHPSGNLKPSQADIRITQQIKEAGKMLDIELLDHFIISNEGYCSMNEEGLT